MNAGWLSGFWQIEKELESIRRWIRDLFLLGALQKPEIIFDSGSPSMPRIKDS